MLRNVLAVIAGLAVGALTNMIVLIGGMVVFPMPPGIVIVEKHSGEIATYFDVYPVAAFVIPWLAHASGTVAGAMVAVVISRTAKFTCALIIGALFLVGGVVNLLQLPHPWVFAVVDALSYLPAAWLGFWLIRGRTMKAESLDAS